MHTSQSPEQGAHAGKLGTLQGYQAPDNKQHSNMKTQHMAISAKDMRADAQRLTNRH